MENSTVSKSEEFGTVDDLKALLGQKRENAVSAVNEYDALIKASFARFPKNEMELVEFIEKVLKHHGVIK